MLPRGWAALAVLALAASVAHAQVSDELGIERFRVAVDRRGIANVEWADTPGHLQWDASLLVGFAHAPLVVYDRDMNAVDALVERRLSTQLVGAVGLYDRIQIGASADIVGYQSGVDGSAGPTMKSLPSSGIGDLRVLAKAKLAGEARYQVGLLATVTVPAGGGRGFLREAGVTFAPALAVSATRGRLRGAINVGYLVRPNVDTAGLRSDDEGFVRAALATAITPELEAFAAYAGSMPLADVEPNRIASELFAGAGAQLTATLGGFVAGGIGLDNGFGTPDWRIVAGVRFGSAPPAVTEQPRPPRVVDKVPPAPDDRDHDGILDPDDRCPDQAETPNAFRDDDGCPEEPAELSGRVVDPTGRAIASATLTIASPESRNDNVELTVDDDGRFKLAVIGGQTVITAAAPEYQPATTTLQIEPGQSGTATITLIRKVRQGQLRGQVLSFDGKPLAATIKVTGGKTTETVTADADGNFTVDLPNGSFQVEVSADGFRTQKRTVSVKLDGVTVLNIDLRGAK